MAYLAIESLASYKIILTWLVTCELFFCMPLSGKRLYKNRVVTFNRYRKEPKLINQQDEKLGWLELGSQRIGFSSSLNHEAVKNKQSLAGSEQMSMLSSILYLSVTNYMILGSH